MEHGGKVYVVDDDAGMRESLRWLIESVGLSVEAFPRAEDFLDHYDPARPGCLVLDLRLPGMGGLRLQEELAARRLRVPIILISGHAEVPSAVQGLRAGAVDFLEKPFSDQVLLDGIRVAIERDRAAREVEAMLAKIAARLSLLTRREREVMRLVVLGKSSKEIGRALEISPKTVDVHRSHIMRKLKVSSVAELTRLVQTAERGLESDPGDLAESLA